MADLISIERVTIDPKKMRAQVRFGEGLPLSTSQNIEATARVYWLMPEIAEHACFGDKGTTFQNVMGDTELAHLLEHVAVELVSRTSSMQSVACGKTRELSEPRTYEIELTCPDDVLCSAALASAADIVQWAFVEKDSKETPDVASIVDGINYMVEKSFELEKDHAEKSASASLVSQTDDGVAPVVAEEPAEASPVPAATSAESVPSAQETAPMPAQSDAVARIDTETPEPEDDGKVLKFDASKIPGNRPL